MAVKTTSQMLKRIEETRTELTAMAKRLDEIAKEWNGSDMRLVPQRMATAARTAGVDDATINNYQEAMHSWITNAVTDLGKAWESVADASRALGPLEHCVSMLRDKAQRARTSR